jgi:hypothetical protein
VGQLPDPSLPVSISPPYSPGYFVGETRNPGRVTTREKVDVRLDTDGAIQTVGVTQTLAVQGKGDIVFNIPVPATSAVPLPSSQSTPGLRRQSLVWQGFSPGFKLLAARLNLRVLEISPILPFRVRSQTRVGGRTLIGKQRAGGPVRIDLQVTDVARTLAHTSVGRADPSDVAGKLDVAWQALRHNRLPPAAPVTIAGRLVSKLTPVTALFTVDGEVSVPGRFDTVQVTGGRVVSRSPLRLRFTGLLGRQHDAAHIVVRGHAVSAGTPVLRLVARAAPAVEALVPPGGKGWVDALRRGLVPHNGRQMLELAIQRLSAAGYTAQFQTFLASPDLAGSSATIYVYRTAPVAPVPVVAATPKHGGTSTLTIVGIALAVLTAGALVVWWAHS